MAQAAFDAVRTQLFAFYQQKQYRQALDLALQVTSEYPEAKWEAAYWRMCLHSVLGEVEPAVQALQGALDQGLWYSDRILRAEPDLAGLQSVPAFEQAVAVCAERMAAAQERAEPKRIVLHPARPQSPAPLLVAIHGNNGSALAFQDRWQSAVDQGWTVVLPQSSQVTAPERYGWNDRTLGMAQVLEHYRQVAGTLPVNRNRTVLAGYSMGGGLCLEMALSGMIEAAGFIAVGPFLPGADEVLKSVFANRPPVPVRGYIIVGDQDVHCYETSKAVAAIMKEHGLPVELEVHEGLGHTFPEPFEASVDRAIRFILES